VSQDVPTELAPVIEAVRAGVDDARRRAQRAETVRRDVLGLSALALRQHGFSHANIADHLGARRALVAECARGVRPHIGPNDDEALRTDVEAVWNAIRKAASPWLQTDAVSTSRDVVRINDIDIGDSPLPVSELNTSGAEFVHQTSGEKIVVYSLQRWKGAPIVHDGDITDWDRVGHYNVEFVAAAGERRPMNPARFGLTAGALTFVGRISVRPPDQDDNVAFKRIVLALRRTYGAFPPYVETALLSWPRGR
jgi:hypothetical protein